MEQDNTQLLAISQGKKLYRLNLKIAQVKPEIKPTPNYWDQNEIEEAINWNE